MNFLLVYCKDCFDHIHDYVIEVLAASVHAEFKTKYVGAGAAVEYAVLNLKKHYKEELLKIKQKLAEAIRDFTRRYSSPSYSSDEYLHR